MSSGFGRARAANGRGALLLGVLLVVATACGNRALDDQGTQAVAEGAGAGELGAPPTGELGVGAAPAGASDGGAGIDPVEGAAGPATGGAATALAEAGPAEGAAGASNVGQGTTIVLGTINHRTGPQPVPGCFEATSAYITDLNARGGINGYKFKLVSYDDGTDVNKAAQQTRRLIEQDKAQALVGMCIDGGGGAPVAQNSRDAGIPVIGGFSGDDAWFNEPHMFPVGSYLQTIYPRVGIDQARKEGVKKVGILYINVGQAQAGAANFRRFAQQAGMEVVYEAAFSLVEADFTSYVSRAKSAGAEAMTLIGSGDNYVKYFQAARQQGFNAKMYAPSPAFDPKIPRAVGDFVDGKLFIPLDLGLPQTAPKEKLERFDAVMKQYYPSQETNWYAMHGWAAGEVFEEAFRRLGSEPFTPQALMAKLRTLKDWQGTFNPPLTYVEGPQKSPMRCVQLIEATSGGYRPLGGPRFICP